MADLGPSQLIGPALESAQPSALNPTPGTEAFVRPTQPDVSGPPFSDVRTELLLVSIPQVVPMLSPSDVTSTTFGEGAPPFEFVMRGNDDGDGSQPSYFTWRHTGTEADFAGAGASPPFGGPTSDIVMLSSTKFEAE